MVQGAANQHLHGSQSLSLWWSTALQSRLHRETYTSRKCEKPPNCHPSAPSALCSSVSPVSWTVPAKRIRGQIPYYCRLFLATQVHTIHAITLPCLPVAPISVSVQHPDTYLLWGSSLGVVRCRSIPQVEPLGNISHKPPVFHVQVYPFTLSCHRTDKETRTVPPISRTKKQT